MLLLSSFLICIVFSSPSFVVHEWGTFTGVQGSNGVSVGGLHHGEQDLPSFVHSRANNFTVDMWKALNEQNRAARLKRAVDGIVPPHRNMELLREGINCGFCEVMDWVPQYGTDSEVTQKLETPVIYFYSPEGVKNVNVTVAFPKGIVTEVYPLYTKNLPEVGKVKSVANGKAEWKVDVANRDAELEIVSVEEDSIWAPSRRVNANSVSNTINNENEKHIFYRGLGRFEQPLSVTSNKTHMVLKNTNQRECIKSAWILKNIPGEKPFLRKLPGIPGGQQITQLISEIKGNSNNENKDLTERFSSVENFISAASVSLEIELAKSGLYELEARAMVDTWSASYFQSEGLRVLYIAPETYPDVLLPWKIEPTPTEEKRVLVGRVEVLLFAEEIELRRHVNVILQDYQSKAEPIRKLAAIVKDTTELSEKVLASYKYVWALGRFAEPKIRRALEGVSTFSNSLVEEWILSALTY